MRQALEADGSRQKAVNGWAAQRVAGGSNGFAAIKAALTVVTAETGTEVAIIGSATGQDVIDGLPNSRPYYVSGLCLRKRRLQ